MRRHGRTPGHDGGHRERLPAAPERGDLVEEVRHDSQAVGGAVAVGWLVGLGEGRTLNFIAAGIAHRLPPTAYRQEIFSFTFANVCEMSFCAWASSTRPPTAATGPRITASPLQFSSVPCSPAGHEIGARRQIHRAAEAAARDLHGHPPRRRVGLQLELELERPPDRADADAHDRVEVRRVVDADLDHLRQAAAHLLGIGDERPHGVTVSRNSLLACAWSFMQISKG